eukprot:534590-Pleurochrysis_carterae.AAC.1
MAAATAEAALLWASHNSLRFVRSAVQRKDATYPSMCTYAGARAVGHKRAASCSSARSGAFGVREPTCVCAGSSVRRCWLQRA